MGKLEFCPLTFMCNYYDQNISKRPCKIGTYNECDFYNRFKEGVREIAEEIIKEFKET